MRAIDIIHAEHRALGAVLQAFAFVLDGIRAGTMQPDFALLEALIEYITEVPDRLHHPKEDDVLFVKILEVLPELQPLITKLQHEHVMGAQSTQALRAALHVYEAAGAAGFAEFDALAMRYIDSSRKHLVTEETELLPVARQKLAPQDWAGIDAAFEANKDPWSGPTGEFRSLYSRIVSMVPAPYGLGPA
jgi:branched-chain amino acid transport system ATP-binding protein